jgi:CheY-like chemotaxis protein
MFQNLCLRSSASILTADSEDTTVSETHKLNILIVDDDAYVRETLAMVLATADYVTSTAKDGIDALVKFKASPSDILLCDLEMPRMSGFELLSVVRRRFPKIAVVAMSGLYDGDCVPDEVIADAFYAKGRSYPSRLFNIVADAIRNSKVRVNARIRDSAPVWARYVGKDTNGMPCVVLSCKECLRSFLVRAEGDVSLAVKETQCVFCLSEIQFVIASSLSSPATVNLANNITCINKPARSLAASDTKLRAAAKGQ